MACLGRARTEVTALVSLLSDPDAATLDRAAPAVGGLGDVSACSNVSALREVIPPPADPAVRRQIDRLRADLAHIEAHRRLGQLSDGLAAGQELVERARAVGYAPVLAAALDATVWFEIETGHDEAAIALGYEAARIAADARDDTLVASGLTRVAFALGADLRRFREAEVAFQSARTATARAGNPGALLERLYSDREQVLYYQGEHLAVMPLCQIVFALSVQLHGPDSYQAALSLSELADATQRLGFQREADRMFQRALIVAETFLGREHPFVLAVLNNAGTSRLDRGDADGAAPFFERALAAKEKVYGPDDASVALSAHNLGIARREQRRLGEARALFERAIRIRQGKLGPAHPLLATSYGERARLDLLEGRPADALADAERAVAILRAAAPPDPSLAEAYTLEAQILVALGRPDEARDAVELAAATVKETGDDPVQRAAALQAGADVLRAGRGAEKALPLYRKALELLEARYGRDGSGLLDALLGLGEAELDVRDAAGALAAAERAVAIVTSNPMPPDEVGAAQFLLARARWARKVEPAASLALARQTRARLAALPYATGTVGRIDGWLIGKP